MDTGYLEKLNDNQRAAVVFGVGEGGLPPPLLVIAGAGSGKTSTLAHRVAHLLVNGADPRRILLMSFSRRAAAELARRVERIAAQAMGTGYAADALTWAGTFHGIGARILREHATEIGLSPDFSIHDREDSADLMALCRHELGLVADREPVSRQGHLPRHLLPRRERRGAAGARAGRALPLVRRVGGGAQAPVRRLRPRQAGAERPGLRRPAARLGAGDGGRRASPRMSAVALGPRAGRRVPGHQPAAGAHPAGAEARRARADGGRRRRAVDLRLPRGVGAQHPRLSRRLLAAGARWSRSTATTARPSPSSTPPTR